MEQAEKEADVIIWDGGNNDTSFYKPDVTITVADPLRAGHEVSYYPGEINFRLADMILINKVDSADAKDVATVVSNAKKFNRIFFCRSFIKSELIIVIPGLNVKSCYFF